MLKNIFNREQVDSILLKVEQAITECKLDDLKKIEADLGGQSIQYSSDAGPIEVDIYNPDGTSDYLHLVDIVYEKENCNDMISYLVSKGLDINNNNHGRSGETLFSRVIRDSFAYQMNDQLDFWLGTLGANPYALSKDGENTREILIQRIKKEDQGHRHSSGMGLVNNLNEIINPLLEKIDSTSKQHENICESPSAQTANWSDLMYNLQNPDLSKFKEIYNNLSPRQQKLATVRENGVFSNCISNLKWSDGGKEIKELKSIALFLADEGMASRGNISYELKDDIIRNKSKHHLDIINFMLDHDFANVKDVHDTKILLDLVKLHHTDAGEIKERTFSSNNRSVDEIGAFTGKIKDLLKKLLERGMPPIPSDVGEKHLRQYIQEKRYAECVTLVSMGIIDTQDVSEELLQNINVLGEVFANLGDDDLNNTKASVGSLIKLER